MIRSLITEPVYLELYEANIITYLIIINNNLEKSENISLIFKKAVFILGGAKSSF